MYQRTLLEDLFGCLIKIWGVVVCSLQDGLGGRCDRIIPKEAPEWPGAHWCLLGKIELFAVDVLPDCLVEVFLSDDFVHRASCLLHLHLEACPASWLAKSIVEASPEAPVLFTLNDCQDLAFSYLVLFLLGGRQSAIQMLLMMVLALLPKVVALIHTGLEAEVYFFNGEEHGVPDIALPCRLLEIASILDPSCMVLKEGLIDLRPTYPQRCFRGEWNPTRLYLTTFLLSMTHILPKLLV
jgi:hypothetical protein